MSISTKGISCGYGVQTTKGTPVVTTAGLRMRKDSLPDLKSGMKPIDLSIRDGRWGDSDYSEMAGMSRPSVTGLPLWLTAPSLKIFLDQVMTAGTPDAGGNVPYTPLATGGNPAATKYLTLLRRNNLATAKDKRMTDSVIKSLKLSSSSENQGVKLDCDFIGSALNTAYNGASDVLTLPTDSILLHKGLTLQVVGLATPVAEWDLTIDWGTVAIVDNQSTPSEFMLGKLTVLGNIRTPWIDDDVLNDFIQNITNTLTFYWGVAGASGYLQIQLPVKYNEPDEDEDGDLRLRQGIPFHYVETTALPLTIKYHP